MTENSQSSLKKMGICFSLNINSKGRQLRAEEVIMKIINSCYYFPSILSSACGFCPRVFKMVAPQASCPNLKKKEHDKCEQQKSTIFLVIRKRSFPLISAFIALSRTNHMATPQLPGKLGIFYFPGFIVEKGKGKVI